MQKLIIVVVALIAASAVRAEDIAVCRQGQSITVTIDNLSPYDEIGGCGASYFYIPATPAPETPSSDPSTVAPTAMPSSTVAPNDMPSASDIPTSAPSSSLPTSAPTSAPTTSPLGVMATLGPNAIVPDNAVSPFLPSTAPVAATIPMMPVGSALPPNDVPVAVAGGSMAAPVSAAPIPNDHHEWQATGSFSHGHMQSVVKANHAIPANMDPNDPKTRVLVFLQFYTLNSVYDNPQQVFAFFTKPQGIHSQRTMRIN